MVERTRNERIYLESDGTVKPEALASNPWLRLLAEAPTSVVNPERTKSFENPKGNGTLDYVMRTLDALDESTVLPKGSRGRKMVEKVLKWSEVAKGGSERDRKKWASRGYPLEIHNEASAMIRADYAGVDPRTDPTCVLIRTHGLPGQFVRGECSFALVAEATEVMALDETISKEEFERIFVALNECVIRGVSDEIWNSVRTEIEDMAKFLAKEGPNGNFERMEKTAGERLHALLPAVDSFSKETVEFFERRVFPKFSLWYFESAFGSFRETDVRRIVESAVEEAGDETRHLNFLPLARVLSYDLDGKRTTNVYVQRIVEKSLAEEKGRSVYAEPAFERKETSLLVSFRLHPACERLAEFCVEAERSGLLSYERNVAAIYDLFGFRRDEFDRLANEGKYLSAMNESARTSTKTTLLDYVRGRTIVDVGSGGGVLLDEMERRFPDAEVIGTDVSENVIETLNARRTTENRKWTAVRHDFTKAPFPRKVDCVVFSSVLHEICSYVKTENGRFDLGSIRKALANAASSLNEGGRILIRDGVSTPNLGNVRIRFLTDAGLDFFKRFAEDFRGMDEIPKGERIVEVDEDDGSVVVETNYGREFLYTYTWGNASYPHEVRERFGCMTAREYADELELLGMRTIRADSFLERGYVEHLSKLVRLENPKTGEEVGFPDSNLIVAAEKR